MTTPSLSLADVRRRVIAAQRIGGTAPDVASAIRTCAGVYGAAPTSHFSLAARVPGYTQSMLEAALVDERSVVRVPAMRSAVYLLPSELAFHGIAMLDERNLDWLQKILEMSRADYERLAGRIESLLAETPGTASDVRTALGPDAPQSPKLTYMLRQMGNEGRIVKTATRGGIRSQRFEYATTRAWLEVPGQRPSLDEALAELVPLWLRAQGPAALADLAWWAGITKERAKAAMAAAGAVAVTIDGLDGASWASPDTLDASAPRGSVGVHLLPVWDVFLMSHRDRGRYLAEHHRPFVVDPSGNVTNVVLDDGVVVGVWDLDGTTLLYGPMPDTEIDPDAVRAAAHAFAGIAPTEDARLVAAQPLSGRGQNVFHAPLRSLL